MPTSPILHVELLTVGRRRRYFVLRVVYALLLFAALAICYLASFDGYRPHTIHDQAQFAFGFFIAFSYIQLLGVLLLTPAMTAGTISSEHERRTIDYLLTTQLHDSEIALGKFAARLWSVTMLLVVGLPILALAMSLGGIGIDRLLISFGTSLATSASIGSLSICISARAAKSREAITRSYQIILAAMAVPPTVVGIASYFGASDGQPPAGFWAWLIEAGMYVVALNPLVFLTAALVERTPWSPLSFPAFLAVHFGVSVLLCLSAIVGVRRFYRREAGRSKGNVAAAAHGAPTAPGIELALPLELALAPASLTAADAAPIDFPRPRTGQPTSNIRRPRLLHDDRAMWWKELVSQKTFLRMGWGGRIATVLLAGAAVFWLGAAWIESFRHAARDDHSVLLAYSFGGVPMIACCCLLLIAVRAAGGLTAEKEQDTWITLLSTPLEGRDVIPAKIGGALYSVRYWYVLIAAAWLLTTLRHPAQIVLLPFLVAAHLTAAVFCAALGVLMSLRMQTSLKAIGTTLAVLVFGTSLLPGIVAGLVQEEEPLGFSLPVCLGAIHPFLNSLVIADRFSSRETGFAFVTVVALVGYGVAAGVLWSVSVHSFDEFVGRICANGRSRAQADAAPQPQAGAAAPSVEPRPAD